MKKPISDSQFEYYNSNPRGVKANDCVIRAISTATGMSWDDVFLGLNQVALKRKIMINEKRVFNEYLKSIGWEKQKALRSLEGKGLNIHDVVFRKGLLRSTVIFGVHSHLSCYKNGKVWDTWDCGDKVVGCYYIQKGNDIC